MNFYNIVKKCDGENGAILAMRRYFQVEESIVYPQDEVQVNFFRKFRLN